ncbi:winged helix-turn-helix domain-containing protein [Nitrolancea hollandica]|uniref:winged helix-turn-helix domain-containing protein n=1 Tax=Nitrolancea hollandica TaxID=1206749 RepID=UPI0009FFEBEB
MARAGYLVGERTIRRTLHRLGWRWKRPKYVLGRPDPDYAKKGPSWNGLEWSWPRVARFGWAMRLRCGSFRRSGQPGAVEASRLKW